MNADYRLDVGFLDHWKTESLMRECGDGAVLSLLRIWAFAARNKPSGVLDGVDLLILERIGKWHGEQGVLASCLVSLRFIEQNKAGVWCLHDWKEHNPYAAHATWRKERAQKANKARREKYEQKQHGFASSTLQATYKRAPAPAPVPTPFPDPVPVPTPIVSKKTFVPPSLEEVQNYCSERKNNVDPQRWHNHYTANGWMVGKVKMKCWKAAVRTWEKTSNKQESEWQ